MNALFKSLSLWYSCCSNPGWLGHWMRALLHLLALWLAGCRSIHCLELLKFPPWSNLSHFLSYFTGQGKSHGMSDFKEASNHNLQLPTRERGKNTWKTNRTSRPYNKTHVYFLPATNPSDFGFYPTLACKSGLWARLGQSEHWIVLTIGTSSEMGRRPNLISETRFRTSFGILLRNSLFSMDTEV